MEMNVIEFYNRIYILYFDIYCTFIVEELIGKSNLMGTKFEIHFHLILFQKV